MKVTIKDLYNEETIELEGSDAGMLAQLRKLFPMGVKDGDSLQEALAQIDSCQAYSVSLDRDSEFRKDLADFIGEELVKSTDPTHYKGIVSGLDPKGADLVDHTRQTHPPQHNAMAEHYRNTILDSPEKVKPVSIERGSGISRKRLFKADGKTYMVKPYHERISRVCKGWMHAPHQGWAEMTNQALYHAAGIGDLHQKVHIAEHNMGPGHEKEPALVIEMEPGVDFVSHSLEADWGPEHKEQARKIVLMDFLSNNLDRHKGNLLKTKEGNLLAIDQSRSFQYKQPGGGKWAAPRKQESELEDSFYPYLDETTSLSYILPRPSRYSPPGEAKRYVTDFAKTLNWWDGVKDDVRQELYKNLQAIKDINIRKHIERNFDTRWRWLNERARFGLENYGTNWDRDEVPLYRPGYAAPYKEED